MDLSADSLLQICLHGETQNVNECLNSIVWTRCPNVFVCRRTFQIGIHSAVLHFNDSTNGVKAVLAKYGLSGKVTKSKSTKHDHERINRMQKKNHRSQSKKGEKH